MLVSGGLAAAIAVCDLPAPNRPLRWHIPARGPPLWDDCDAQSVGALKHGSILVESAGQNIRNIVTCVLEVSSSVESIRDSTHEQMVEGVKHIHAAVNGLDKATQQNAAMVQESAFGAKSLTNETEQLRRAVEVFKV